MLNFAFKEIYELRMAPTHLGLRSLRATPYPAI
jgi:hypothetical protein